MKHFFNNCLGLFSFRQLKTWVLFMFLSVFLFVMYLALFTVHLEKKQLIETAKRVKHVLQNPSEVYRSSNFCKGHQEHQFVEDEVVEPDMQQQPPWKPKYRGLVNMHVFEDWCGSSIEQLRTNVLYPLFPHTQTTVSRLAIYPKWTNYGLRIFGYIHPPSSDQYIFAISSDKNSEFWLSLNEKPKNLRLLAFVGKTGAEWAAPGEYGKFASQISQPVILLKDMKYFFEVIFKHSEGIDHLEVAWRQNQRNNKFAVITSKYLSLYTNETSVLMGDIAHIPQTKASHDLHPDKISKQSNAVVDMVRDDPRDFIYKIPLINESSLKNVFPECDYKPLNIFNGKKIQRFQGVSHVYYSSVYPNDYTRQTHTATDEMCFYNQDKAFRERGGFIQYLKTEDKAAEKADPEWNRIINVTTMDFYSKQTTLVLSVCKRAGNVIIDEQTALYVVDAAMTHLTESISDLVLKRVLNVERRPEGDVDGRYFLELELEDDQGQSRLFSQYFYISQVTNNEKSPEVLHQHALCSPKGFSWNPAAIVHVILPVKNQGRWVIQFIRQMENIYQATGDNNFNIIIVDYSSDDIDVEKELKNANLPSYQYIRLEGTFLKTTALQTAIDLIKDDNSILFTCDLHLHFPVSIIYNVRKHCIQGKMVFAPVVMRLDCGATAQAPTGFWEIDGYGLIGIYKSDMDRIGGMNTKEFKDKWGGEDWELLDRILENQLEVERLNVRNFLHYYHSKRGMWNN